MPSIAFLLLLSVELVSDGQAKLALTHDESPAGAAAAELLRRHVVLLSGVALPTEGLPATLHFERTDDPGYTIEQRGDGLHVHGRALTVAVLDLLHGWGCRFEGAKPHLPRSTSLTVQPTRWQGSRPLYLESDRIDLLAPATGVARVGLSATVPARARALGYTVRVASPSFDDFLPPSLHAKHPEYFALRRGERVARGNFALTNAAARARYLDAVEAWWSKRPDVDVLGLWPEVTSVWCEESIAIGHAQAYALLWREAAARFPNRRIEILATGATMRPPQGKVPTNVEVRLRPGREASALQPIAEQSLHAIVRAWELRGARVLLEIDAAPESWCGLPWPCHEAIRGDARRFAGAILRHATRAHALLWHDPDAKVEIDEEMAALLPRARTVPSWGDPADTARLWPEDGPSVGARMGRLERARERALRTARADVATETWFGFVELAHALGHPHGTTYRRLRGRAFRALLSELLPDGAVRQAGGLTVQDRGGEITVETTVLRLVIEQRGATVIGLHRRAGAGWSDNLLGGQGRAFSVAALGGPTRRSQGSVVVRENRIELRAPGWTSTLTFDGSSARVRQTATVESAGGIAVGHRSAPGTWREWVCPSYAREGGFENPSEPRQASFRLVPSEPLWVRGAPGSAGLALRLPQGGIAAVVDSTHPALVATSRRNRIVVDWITFALPGELGR
ncbi:MAG: hypothetical protein AAGD14_14380 [Planctomycetota bacterium]